MKRLAELGLVLLGVCSCSLQEGRPRLVFEVEKRPVALDDDQTDVATFADNHREIDLFQAVVFDRGAGQGLATFRNGMGVYLSGLVLCEGLTLCGLKDLGHGAFFRLAEGLPKPDLLPPQRDAGFGLLAYRLRSHEGTGGTRVDAPFYCAAGFMSVDTDEWPRLTLGVFVRLFEKQTDSSLFRQLLDWNQALRRDYSFGLAGTRATLAPQDNPIIIDWASVAHGRPVFVSGRFTKKYIGHYDFVSQELPRLVQLTGAFSHPNGPVFFFSSEGQLHGEFSGFVILESGGEMKFAGERVPLGIELLVDGNEGVVVSTKQVDSSGYQALLRKHFLCP